MASVVRPILPDVYAEVRDGGLGLAAGNLEGIHVKVGVASAGDMNTITYLSSQRDAISKFGTGPLVDACVDSFSSGGQVIYAMRAAASIPGSIGGTISLWVECVKAGECGVAQIRYSLDGGISFASRVTVPDSGKVEITSRNITLQIPPTYTIEVEKPVEKPDAGDSEEHTEDSETQTPTTQKVQETRKSSLNGGDLWKFSVDTVTGSVYPMGTDVTGTGTMTATAKKTAVTKSGTGTGTLTVSGEPLVNAEVLIQITASGTTNGATYVYSIDGGDTMSGNITVPEEETEIAGTGIMLTFSGEFEAGDTWEFVTNAPQMSNGDLIECLELLNEASIEYEFIHVVGECGRSTWAACQSMADTMFKNHRYTFFVVEARKRTPKESADEWTTSLVEEANKFAGMRVVAVPTRLELVDMNSGYQIDRNAAGAVAGLISSTPIQRSIGSVMYNPVSIGLEINPYPQMKYANIVALDSAGYTTMRRYVGRSGIYITNGYTMAESGSDFRELTYLRVMNKACRLMRDALLSYLHGEADAAGLNYIQARAESALMNMRTAGEIADFRVQIPRNQNILGTNEVVIEGAIQPIGIIKWIKLAVGYENPAIRELINNAG